ncbi:MAG TPA: hypothetical protein VGZ02_08900 [Candidatus Baltobacteraceae bacterium]|jgi:Cu/Zn superoxide dismutase|nr:hypothetical protein [Candidatus Baltobacteraceae bacterium]
MLVKPVLGALVISSLLGSAAIAASPASVTVKMHAQNGSGENGTATLTQLPAGVKVVVDLTGAPATDQPTHIHPGTCAKLNPKPEYPLSPSVNGKSTTVLKGMKLSSLLGGMYSVNVHKSSDDLKTYVSCGVIK